MEPRIQYAKTKDGVSIAYWTLGEGRPLILIWPSILSNTQLEWQLPEWRHWYEGLARGRMLVRYDTMGSGLSDKDLTDFSLDSHLTELEALVNRLRLDSFDAVGLMQGGPVAIAWAAGHPGQISRLILLHSWARSSEFFGSPAVRGLKALEGTDWDGWMETLTRVYLTRREGEDAQKYLAAMREHVVPEVQRAHDAAFENVDVSSLLPRVTCPTLVLQRRQVRIPGVVDIARHLASEIPDARLTLLEGDSFATHLGDTDAILRAIDEFLGDGEEAHTAAAPSAFRTILFTDMESSTTLTRRLGDAAAQEVLRTHNTIVRDALKAHDGSETKHTGDGIMASFASASRALECAIAIQRAFAAHNESANEPIRVRIGLNAGEPVAEDEDLFGTAVQLAARICAHAEPEQILAPIVVRELAVGKRFLFADLGGVAPRGFDDPVRLFEVRWRD
jgi:class 3 adenylate cyclase